MGAGAGAKQRAAVWGSLGEEPRPLRGMVGMVARVQCEQATSRSRVVSCEWRGHEFAMGRLPACSLRVLFVATTPDELRILNKKKK